MRGATGEFHRIVPAALAIAALVGTVHGLFSLYWGAGGTWLLWSLGERLVDAFAGMRWVLLPLGLFKIGCAVAPFILARAGWPRRRLSRVVCWLGAATLVTWGGVNTVAAHLVLSDVVHPEGGYDHPGMIGHAWLWDPLFLVWGAALAVGMVATREHRGVERSRTGRRNGR